MSAFDPDRVAVLAPKWRDWQLLDPTGPEEAARQRGDELQNLASRENVAYPDVGGEVARARAAADTLRGEMNVLSMFNGPMVTSVGTDPEYLPIALRLLAHARRRDSWGVPFGDITSLAPLSAAMFFGATNEPGGGDVPDDLWLGAMGAYRALLSWFPRVDEPREVLAIATTN